MPIQSAVPAIDSYLVTSDRKILTLTGERPYIFGRTSDADVVVVDTMCSRKHCRLRLDQSATWVVEDLGSRNGTYIEGVRIQAPHELGDGSSIQIGGQKYTLRLLPPGTDPTFLRNEVSAVQSVDTFEIDSDLLEQQQNAGPSASPFQGDLPEGGLRELIRFFTITGKTGRVLLDAGGEIWFDEGVPRHAVHGDESGMEALLALLNQTGRFAFEQGRSRSDLPTITGRMADILAEIGSGDAAAEEQRYDLAQATELQQHLLSRLPDIPGIEIGVFFQGLVGVSGDFYDVSRMPDGRILAVLGDVSGHGVQAAMVATNTLKALRLLRREHGDLLELLEHLHQEIEEDLLPKQFMTLAAVAIDPSRECVTVVLAGHHQVVLILPDGSLQQVGQTAMAIGFADAATFRSGLRPQTVPMPVDAKVALFTDGMLEGVDATGSEYGWERLLASLARHAGEGDLQYLTQHTVGDVVGFAETIEDDLTILALRRGSQASTRVRERSGAHSSGGGNPSQTAVQPGPMIESGTHTHRETAGHPSQTNIQLHPPSVPTPPISEHVGPIRLLKKLPGSEGANTWLGQHQSLHMQVVVRLRSEFAAGMAAESLVSLLNRCSTIHHPNIAQTLEVGLSDSGVFYHAYEFVRGRSLAQRVGRQGPMLESEVIRALAPIAEALVSIHAGGFWHGRIRPDAIVVDAQQRPRLIGFGWAMLATHAAGERIDMATAQQDDIRQLAETAAWLLAGSAVDSPASACSRHDLAELLEASVGEALARPTAEDLARGFTVLGGGGGSAADPSVIAATTRQRQVGEDDDGWEGDRAWILGGLLVGLPLVAVLVWLFVTR